MSATEIVSYIRAKVQHFENIYKLTRGKAFMMWFAIEALEMGEDEAFEAVSYDGGNDKNIDLFYVDDYYERVLIGQGKYQGQGRYKANRGEFFELLHSTDWLSNPESFERLGRKDLAAAAREYVEAVDKGYGVEFIYVYMGPKHRDVQDEAHQFTQREVGAQPPKSARALHLDVLARIHDEHIERATRINTHILPLQSSLYFEERGPFGRALVASVPARALKELYERHGDPLFDRQVRLFLGARKGSVNAGIRDTLATPKERGYFWAYNNGLTFVCDRYSYSPEDKAITLSNFSIVNGCQTTVTIANASSAQLKGVYVLARFISASQEPIIDSIILYTNSQTPIRPWEIACQDKTQKQLKKDLAKDPNPYFYQTRKGETRRLKGADRARYRSNGKLRTIVYDQLAQYLGAFIGLPTIAYKDKAKLFGLYRDMIFPTDVQPEKAILVWRAGEAAEAAVREELEDAVNRKDDEQIRILRRGGKLFVLAVMSVVLTERNGPHYIRQIKREVATSMKTAERLARYAKLGTVWYVQVVKDMLDSGADLVHLLRSQEFFAKVKDKVLALWKVQSMSQKWVDDALPKL